MPEKRSPKEERELLRESMGLTPETFLYLSMQRILMAQRRESNFKRDLSKDLLKTMESNMPCMPGHGWVSAKCLSGYLASSLMLDAIEGSDGLMKSIELYQNERYKLVEDILKFMKEDVLENINKTLDDMMKDMVIPYIFEGKPLSVNKKR